MSLKFNPDDVLAVGRALVSRSPPVPFCHFLFVVFEVCEQDEKCLLNRTVDVETAL